MISKTLKLVVTSHTPAAAMAMEALGKAQHLTGRLHPTPRELTAACGMHRQKKGFFAVLVWRTSASWKNQMPCINIYLSPMVKLHPL